MVGRVGAMRAEMHICIRIWILDMIQYEIRNEGIAVTNRQTDKQRMNERTKSRGGERGREMGGVVHVQQKEDGEKVP